MNQNTWRLLHDNDKLMTVRVNSMLFDAFKKTCEEQDVSISMAVREFMVGTVMASQVDTTPEDLQAYVRDMADILYDAHNVPGKKGGDI